MYFFCELNFDMLWKFRFIFSFKSRNFIFSKYVHIFSRQKSNFAFYRHFFLKCIWTSDSFALFYFILVPLIGTIFFIAMTVFIVEYLGEGVTIFNSFIFASFNCKSIQFQFLQKDLICFIFIKINLKDKSRKIYLDETLAVLKCNLCQLSNVVSKF